jgi:hypothetical protein
MPSTINRELAMLKSPSFWPVANGNGPWVTHYPKPGGGSHQQTCFFLFGSPASREFCFAVHTGMRRGEILALTWAGLDFTRRTVTVFKSKNGERRTIPVNQTVLDLLSQPSCMAATLDQDLQ